MLFEETLTLVKSCNQKSCHHKERFWPIALVTQRTGLKCQTSTSREIIVKQLPCGTSDRDKGDRPIVSAGGELVRWLLHPSIHPSLYRHTIGSPCG